MLTVEALRQCGANTNEGLSRCLNNEAFYLRLVNLALNDANFEKLTAAFSAGDRDAAFQAAHALKGSLSNLALTPLLRPVSALTDLLRGGQMEGCAAYLEEITKVRSQLLALREG